MSGVVLTGSAGALGRRVAAGLAASPAFDRVVCIDMVSSTVPVPAGCNERQIDLLVDDLAPHFRGADTVVHLASVFAPDRFSIDTKRDVELTRRVLDASAAAQVSHVVLMSSATAYGASPANPVPMTEDTPLDPNPGFAFAHDKVEIERLGTEFRDAHSDSLLTILRPTTTLAEGEVSWVAAALTTAVGLRAGDIDPPVQFLHFDDLASATVLVAERRCGGVFNVAPDGWIPPDQMHALAGVPRPRVPPAVAKRLAGLRWQLGMTPTPPQILPWIMYPWVIANDRLRAEGWCPTHSNEEAYVAGTVPGPLETLSPKRRQELALGIAGAALAAAGVGAAVAFRRLRGR